MFGHYFGNKEMLFETIVKEAPDQPFYI